MIKILILCVFLFSIGFYLGITFATKKFQAELNRMLDFTSGNSNGDE